MSKSKNKKQSVTEIEYIVEAILDKKIEKDHPKYLVKWAGYPDSENTWEPLENLTNCVYLLEKYENSIKKNNLNSNILSSAKNLKTKKIDKEDDKAIELNKYRSFIDHKTNEYKKNSDIRSFFIVKNNSKTESLLGNKRKSSSNIDKFSVSFNTQLNSKTKNNQDSPSKQYLDNSGDENFIKSNLPKRMNSFLVSNNSPNTNKKKNYDNRSEDKDDDVFIISSSIGQADKQSKFTHKNFSSQNPNNLKDKDQKQLKTGDGGENLNLNEEDDYSRKRGLGKSKSIEKYICLDKDSSDDKGEYASQIQVISRPGKLGQDKPIRIKSCKIIDNELLCLIEWQQVNPDEIIKPSEYSNNLIKIYDSFLLLRFYEERVKF